MTTSTTLLDWILELLRDPNARDSFRSDPEKYASEHGVSAVTASDVHDALCLAVDADHGSSHDSADSRDSHHGGHHPSPPRHHESPTHYLTHYINHYETVEKYETNIDDSVHQHVDTHGGDFDQHLDNDPVVASGAHSVAAGGGITDSTLTSGDGNVVGDNDQATTGNGNETAFGTGDASSTSLDHADFGRGSGFSVDGDAEGHNTNNATDTAVHNSGSGATSVSAAGTDGHSGQYADQHESDQSEHSNYSDHSHTTSSEELNSHNSGHLADSHDYDVHH